MPAFDARMEDEQRWRVVSYVRSLTPHESGPISSRRHARQRAGAELDPRWAPT
jgi:mono/diheme cytochrome c family protein